MKSRAASLIRLAIVHNPTRNVFAARVIVGPVDDSTLRVPFILAVEANSVAFLKTVDSWGEVDVV